MKKTTPSPPASPYPISAERAVINCGPAVQMQRRAGLSAPPVSRSDMSDYVETAKGHAFTLATELPSKKSPALAADALTIRA